MRLSQRKLDFALTRIRDFHSVHSDKPADELLEPLSILLNSTGLDEERVTYLNGWLEEYGGGPVDDSMLLGMLIALIASDCED